MNYVPTMNVLAAAIACGSMTTTTMADGLLGDLLVYELDGRLVTGHYDFDGGTGLVTDFGPTFVYTTELQPNWEGGGTPGTDEPGIATDGSHPNDPDGKLLAFPANTALRATANVLPTLGLNAAFWDGSGAVNFTATPHALSIEDAFNLIPLDGSNNTPVGSVSPWISGPTGTNHDHLEFLINEPDANATAGVYLFSLTFAAGELVSDPVFFVAGFGLPEPQLDEAIEAAEAWVESNLVPEPATWFLGSLGVLALVHRQRDYGTLNS